MKTAKECLNDEIWKDLGQTLDTFLTIEAEDGREYSLSGSVMPAIIRAMEEYKNQESDAVKFAEWIRMYYVQYVGYKWQLEDNRKAPLLTTEELYKLFKEQTK